MTCREARIAMLDRAESRRAGRSRGLARHLERCPSCRAEFHALAETAERLNLWADLPELQAAEAACVAALLSDRSLRLPRSGAAMARTRFAFAGALAAAVLFAGPILGGVSVSGISAEIGDALSDIDVWRAEGTATPPLIGKDSGAACNHIEIWFRKPDTLVLRVDAEREGGPILAMTRQGSHVSLDDPLSVVDESLRERARTFSYDQLFSVASWAAKRSLLSAPVREMGLSRFGDRVVRRIRVCPTEGWLADTGQAPQPGVQVLVDSETMLPVLLETTTHGSVVILDFDYGLEFPGELLANAA